MGVGCIHGWPVVVGQYMSSIEQASSSSYLKKALTWQNESIVLSSTIGREVVKETKKSYLGQLDEDRAAGGEYFVYEQTTKDLFNPRRQEHDRVV